MTRLKRSFLFNIKWRVGTFMRLFYPFQAFQTPWQNRHWHQNNYYFTLATLTNSTRCACNIISSVLVYSKPFSSCVFITLRMHMNNRWLGNSSNFPWNWSYTKLQTYAFGNDFYLSSREWIFISFNNQLIWQIKL